MIPTYARKYLVEKAIGSTPMMEKFFANIGTGTQATVTATQAFLFLSAIIKN